jgi:prevent-host-death family protein
VRSVTIRELRNHGGDVIDRVSGGESMMVTRNGKPVAELRPVTSEPLTADIVVARRRTLPALELVRLRRDIDRLLDPEL